MKIRARFLFALLMLLALPLSAALKSGKYNVTINQTVDGKAMPAQTVGLCLTGDAADNPEAFSAAMTSQGCKVQNLKTEGDTTTWTFTCENKESGNATGSGSVTRHTDRFESHQTVQAMGKKIEASTSGVWVSAQCEK